uniref:Uncharacterized protein n=1 Tax=Oryza brachyantha TaxID=4533 RepID=J3M5N5_ORYBR
MAAASFLMILFVGNWYLCAVEYIIRLTNNCHLVYIEPLEINEEDYTEGAEEKQAMDENPEGLYGDIEVDEQ